MNKKCIYILLTVLVVAILIGIFYPREKPFIVTEPTYQIKEQPQNESKSIQTDSPTKPGQDKG